MGGGSKIKDVVRRTSQMKPSLQNANSLQGTGSWKLDWEEDGRFPCRCYADLQRSYL